MPNTARLAHQLVLWLMLSLAAPAAWACTVNPGASADFGSVSSFAIANSVQTTEALPNAGVSCRGSLLQVLNLSDQWIRATAISANGSTLVNAASGDAIPYRAFASAAEGEELFPGTTYNFFNPVLIDLLGLIGGQVVDIPLEFHTQPSSNIAAGTYSDTLTINWDWRICDVALLACLSFRTGSDTSTLQLSLEVTPDCAIEAPDLHFGSAPLVAGFDPVAQTLHITCTKGSDYSVGLSDGQHASGVTRRMAHNGSYLEYQLYKSSSGFERWGDIGSERRSSASADFNPGTPDGAAAQGFTYRGEILPEQTTPPPDTYTDAIVVDVTF